MYAANGSLPLDGRSLLHHTIALLRVNGLFAQMTSDTFAKKIQSIEPNYWKNECSFHQFFLPHHRQSLKNLQRMYLCVCTLKYYSRLSIFIIAWPFNILQNDNIMISWDFFRLTAPRCPGMAAGALSLRKSHDVVILSFCNMVKGQTKLVLLQGSR